MLMELINSQNVYKCDNNSITLERKSHLPDVVGAAPPNPPKFVPPNPDAAAVVVVLKPPNAGAGADVDGAPKPLNYSQNALIKQKEGNQMF